MRKLVFLLASDETNELGDAFLNRVLSVLRDLPISRQRLLHDPTYIRDREVPVLLPNIGPRALIPATLMAPAGWTRRSICHSRRKPKFTTTTKKNQQQELEEQNFTTEN